jgi:hypothetical protein
MALNGFRVEYVKGTGLPMGLSRRCYNFLFTP